MAHRSTPRVNLLHAHGSPTQYLYRWRDCRCSLCRAVRSDYDAAYHVAHREKKIAAARAWYAEHPDQARSTHDSWVSDHREQLAAYEDARRPIRRQYHVERRAAYRATHQVEIIAYRDEHRERAAELSHRWRIEHSREAAARERCQRARRKGAPGIHTAEDVGAQYTRQKGCCYWCGVKVGGDYHVDHVIPLILGGSNGPENLVIACPRCNLSKGAKMPHEFSERLC